jgi:plasmid maintenance system antidote protein VapI
MQSEMVARVAKAIRDSMESWVPMEGDYDVMARAAIAAMREPSQEMVDAIDENVGAAYVVMWRCMIDAALA